jgi:MFS family permease
MTMPSTQNRTATFRHALVLLLGSCLPVMAAVLIAPVLPQIMQHYAGVPHAEALVPLALTIPALSVGIISPLAGMFVDRFGRKRLLLASMVLYAAVGTAPLYLESLTAIIASRAGVGVAEAFIMTICTSMIADYFSGALRERYLAQQTMWASIAATLFFGIGGALGEAGWRTSFWMYAIALLLLPVMAIMLWEPRPEVAAHGAEGQIAAKRTFPIKAVLGICAVTLGSAIAFYTLPVHMGFVLQAIGVTAPAKIGMATAIGSVANVVGAVAFRRLSALGVPYSLAIAFGTLGGGFLAVSAASDLKAAVIGAILNGFGAGLLLPTLLTWLMRQLRFEERGRGAGAFTASFFVGQFACPLIVLGLNKSLGGLGAAISGLGWVAVGAAIAAAGSAIVLRPGGVPNSSA